MGEIPSATREEIGRSSLLFFERLMPPNLWRKGKERIQNGSERSSVSILLNCYLVMVS